MTELTFNETKQPFGLMFFEKFTKNHAVNAGDTTQEPLTALTNTASQTSTHRMGGDIDAGGDIDSW